MFKDSLPSLFNIFVQFFFTDLNKCDSLILGICLIVSQLKDLPILLNYSMIVENSPTHISGYIAVIFLLNLILYKKFLWKTFNSCNSSLFLEESSTLVVNRYVTSSFDWGRNLWDQRNASCSMIWLLGITFLKIYRLNMSQGIHLRQEGKTQKLLFLFALQHLSIHFF